MKKFVRIFSLALAFAGVSGSIASACCTTPDPCAESVTCKSRQIVGSIGATDAKATPVDEDPITGPVPSLTGFLSEELRSLGALIVRFLGEA